MSTPEPVTLTLKAMAHGGAAIGRGPEGKPIFVPLGIPGEQVRVAVTDEKKRYAWAELVQVVAPSPDRVTPRCAHFGVCGGCHLQHMAYAAQLRAKQAVAVDQLQRIGHFQAPPVRAVLPAPDPWAYGVALALSPTPAGGFGLWSPVRDQVIPIEMCPITHPALVALLADVELALPGLRRLTLRIGVDEAMLAALEVDDMEPPELAVDFPVSVALVLPDQTAASLIGDHYVVQSVHGRDFRVSPGSDFYPGLAAAAQAVEAVLALAGLQGAERVLELYSGVGTLTAFLAARAATVVAVEANPDAVADTAVNLADMDNVSLYEGLVEEVTPLLPAGPPPDLVVTHPPPAGLSREALQAVVATGAARLIYVSGDVATLARDGRQLAQAGYRLEVVQPIDMRPQTYHVDTVSLWTRTAADGQAVAPTPQPQ